MSATVTRLSSACDPAADADRCAATLPENPQCTLNVHFGQLLGVADVRALQGFHVGQARRHQRALHGHGVVAGYAVTVDGETAELRVSPGHAIDLGGRDLLIEQAQCLSLARWWAARLSEKDPDYAEFWDRDTARIDLQVLLSYTTCLTVPVPAVADPCQRQSSDIAYARVCESARLSLQRVEASDEAPVAPPSGPTPGADRDAWVAFLAALPPDAVPDADHPAAIPPVLLARLTGVQFDRVDGQWQASVDAVDMSVRPLLLSTATLQRALMPALATPPLVGGPVMVAAGSAAVGATVTLVFSQPLAAASVAAQAFTVTQFDATTGWRSLTVDAATYTEPAGVPTVTLALNGPRDDTLAVRVTAQGRGPTPLMGASGWPLGALEPQADGQQLSITLS